MGAGKIAWAGARLDGPAKNFMGAGNRLFQDR
jgi:hypothetical protein